MNEIQRHSYLAALGIDSYTPRWILPGAPVPRVCALSLPQAYPQEIVQVTEHTTRHATRHAKNSAAAGNNEAGGGTSPVKIVGQPPESESDYLTGTSLESAHVDTSVPIEKGNLSMSVVLSGLTESRRAKSSAQVLQSKPRISTISSPVARFSLGLWRVSDELLIVDSRDVKLALPTDLLLANIVAALGYSLPALPKAEILRWPMVDAAPANQDEAQARDMLQGYLDVQLLQRPARYLMLMGEEAARYVLPEPQPFAQLQGKTIVLEAFTTSELGAVSAVVTPSLAAMLQNPTLKAVTWRAIQPLRIDRL